MLDTHARKYVEPFIVKSAKKLIALNLTANQVTVAALIIGLSTSVFILLEQPVIAVMLLWFSGFLDAVDGSMARLTKTSEFGTVLDVTFDRLVEIAIIVTLAFVFPEAALSLLLLSGAIIFSMTVFLTVGAVSEKKGKKSFYYQAGLAERTEGFILFSLMILLPSLLQPITLLYAGVVIFTGLQRLVEAKKMLS